MDLEQTKKLVTYFFVTTDEGVAMTTFEPDDEARNWLKDEGYLLRNYGDVYIIAKREEDFPTEEKANEIIRQMEEYASKAKEVYIKRQLDQLRLLKMLGYLKK